MRYVKHNFMATIGDGRDITVLNDMLARWAIEVAGKCTHGTSRKQPLKLLEQIEKPVMRALPTLRWRPVSRRTPMVLRGSHCLIGGAPYSAPWRLIDKRLLARIGDRTVELY